MFSPSVEYGHCSIVFVQLHLRLVVPFFIAVGHGVRFVSGKLTSHALLIFTPGFSCVPISHCLFSNSDF